VIYEGLDTVSALFEWACAKNLSANGLYNQAVYQGFQSTQAVRTCDPSFQLREEMSSCAVVDYQSLLFCENQGLGEPVAAIYIAYGEVTANRRRIVMKSDKPQEGSNSLG
jgi:hypothetical protein